jgi:hypothetical protein
VDHDRPKLLTPCEMGSNPGFHPSACSVGPSLRDLKAILLAAEGLANAEIAQRLR